MYKIINKSRQGLPVMVKKDGKLTFVNLSYSGDDSTCYSEEKTEAIVCLESNGFIKIEEVIQEIVAEKVVEEVVQSPQKSSKSAQKDQ